MWYIGFAFLSFVLFLPEYPKRRMHSWWIRIGWLPQNHIITNYSYVICINKDTRIYDLSVRSIFTYAKILKVHPSFTTVSIRGFITRNHYRKLIKSCSTINTINVYFEFEYHLLWLYWQILHVNSMKRLYDIILHFQECITLR